MSRPRHQFVSVYTSGNADDGVAGGDICTKPPEGAAGSIWVANRYPWAGRGVARHNRRAPLDAYPCPIRSAEGVVAAGGAAFLGAGERCQRS